MENAALTHYATLAENALRIVTPDETVNKNLAWAEVALDQARVCNPDLGCGSVGGYGPSRWSNAGRNTPGSLQGMGPLRPMHS